MDVMTSFLTDNGTGSAFVMDRLQNEVHHSRRRGDEGRMVDGMRVHPRLHAVGHEPLRLLSDHSVSLRDEKPTGAVLPKGTFNRDGDTGWGDWSLHGRQKCMLLMCCVLSKRRCKRI